MEANNGSSNPNSKVYSSMYGSAPSVPTPTAPIAPVVPTVEPTVPRNRFSGVKSFLVMVGNFFINVGNKIKIFWLANKKKIYKGVGIIGAVLLVVLAVKWLIEPSATPDRVRVTNKTDSGFTVSWVTYGKPTQGSVYVYKTGSKWIPAFSYLFGEQSFDERDILVKQEYKKLFMTRKRYVTHYINITNLDPKTKYSIRIKVGNKTYTYDKDGKQLGSVQTFPKLNATRAADPSYGKVSLNNGIFVKGAVVYVKLIGAGGRESNLLSGLTNADGRYWYDPSALRNSSGTDYYKSSNPKEIIMVDSGDLGRGLQLARPDSDKPSDLVIVYAKDAIPKDYGVPLVQKLEGVEIALQQKLSQLSNKAQAAESGSSEFATYPEELVYIFESTIVAFAVGLIILSIVLTNFTLIRKNGFKAFKTAVFLWVIFDFLGLHSGAFLLNEYLQSKSAVHAAENTNVIARVIEDGDESTSGDTSSSESSGGSTTNPSSATTPIPDDDTPVTTTTPTWTSNPSTESEDPSDYNPPTSCLVAGDTLRTVKGPKSIDDLEIGDKVLGKTGYNAVERIRHLKHFGYYEVLFSLNGKSKSVNLTGEHKVIMLDGSQKMVKELVSGDDSFAGDILSTKYISDISTVYNITVDGDRTFYVNGLLVHNKIWMDDEGDQTVAPTTPETPEPQPEPTPQPDEEEEESFVAKMRKKVIPEAQTPVTVNYPTAPEDTKKETELEKREEALAKKETPVQPAEDTCAGLKWGEKKACEDELGVDTSTKKKTVTKPDTAKPVTPVTTPEDRKLEKSIYSELPCNCDASNLACQKNCNVKAKLDEMSDKKKADEAKKICANASGWAQYSCESTVDQTALDSASQSQESKSCQNTGGLSCRGEAATLSWKNQVNSYLYADADNDGLSAAAGDYDDNDPTVFYKIQADTRDGKAFCANTNDCPFGKWCNAKSGQKNGNCVSGTAKKQRGETCKYSSDCAQNPVQLVCLNGTCAMNAEVTKGSGVDADKNKAFIDDCVKYAGNDAALLQDCQNAVLTQEEIREGVTGVSCPKAKNPNDCDGDGINNNVEIIAGVNPYLDYDRVLRNPEIPADCSDIPLDTPGYEQYLQMCQNGTESYNDVRQKQEDQEEAQNVINDVKQTFPNVEECFNGVRSKSDWDKLGCQALKTALEEEGFTFDRELNQIGITRTPGGSIGDYLPFVPLLKTGGMFGGSAGYKNVTDSQASLEEQTGLPATVDNFPELLDISEDKYEQVIEELKKRGYLPKDFKMTPENIDKLRGSLSQIEDLSINQESCPPSVCASGWTLTGEQVLGIDTSYANVYLDENGKEMAFLKGLNEYQQCLNGDVQACKGGTTADEIKTYMYTNGTEEAYRSEVALNTTFAVMDIVSAGAIAKGAIEGALGKALQNEVGEEFVENIGKAEIKDIVDDSFTKATAGFTKSGEEVTEEAFRKALKDEFVDELESQGIKNADEIAEEVVDSLDDDFFNSLKKAGGKLDTTADDAVDILRTGNEGLAYDPLPAFDNSPCAIMSHHIFSRVYAEGPCSFKVQYGRQNYSSSGAVGNPEYVSRSHLTAEVDSHGFITITDTSTHGTAIIDTVTGQKTYISKGEKFVVSNQPGRYIVQLGPESTATVSVDQILNNGVPVTPSNYAPVPNPNPVPNPVVDDLSVNIKWESAWYDANIDAEIRKAGESALKHQVDFMRAAGVPEEKVQAYIKMVKSRPIVINDPDAIAASGGRAYATQRIHIKNPNIVWGERSQIYNKDLPHEMVHLTPMDWKVTYSGTFSKGQGFLGLSSGDEGVSRTVHEGFTEFTAQYIESGGSFRPAAATQTTANYYYRAQTDMAWASFQHLVNQGGKAKAERALAYYAAGEYEAFLVAVGDCLGISPKKARSWLYKSFAPVRLNLFHVTINEIAEVRNIINTTTVPSTKGRLVTPVLAADTPELSYKRVGNNDQAIARYIDKNTLLVSMGTTGYTSFPATPGQYNIYVTPYKLSHNFTKNATGLSLLIPIDARTAKPIGIYEKPAEKSNAEGDVTISFFMDNNGNKVQDKSERSVSVENTDIRVTLISSAYRYDLTTGWNMVSFPFEMQDMTASKLIAEIANQGGYATTIAKFESGRWISYKVRANKVYSDEDFEIKPGEGYLIKVMENIVIGLAGQQLKESQPLNLVEGWNLIGFHPGTDDKGNPVWTHTLEGKSWTADKVIKQLQSEGIEATTITRYEGGKYVSYIYENGKAYGFDFDITPITGYFVLVKKNNKGSSWKL